MDIETLRKKYKAQLLAIAARNKVENVRIFSSVTRGETTETSYIDFLIHATRNPVCLLLVGFIVSIDIVCDTGLNLYLKNAILDEAVRI